MVTGVGVQGDSDNDYWVKTFKLSHGITKDNMQDLAQVRKIHGKRIETLFHRTSAFFTQLVYVYYLRMNDEKSFGKLACQVKMCILFLMILIA